MKYLNLVTLAFFFSILFTSCDDNEITEPKVVEQWHMSLEDTLEDIGYATKIEGLFNLDFTEKNFNGFGKFSYNFNLIDVESDVIEMLFENNYSGTYTDPDIYFRMEDKYSRSYVEYSGSWSVKDESFRGLLIIGFESIGSKENNELVHHFYDEIILSKRGRVIYK